MPFTFNFILLQIRPPKNIPPAAPGTAAAPVINFFENVIFHFGDTQNVQTDTEIIDLAVRVQVNYIDQ